MNKKIKYLILFTGFIALALLGYRLFLEYYPDLQMLLDPKVSRATLMKQVRSHGISSLGILVLLTAIMCAIPGLPTSILGVFIGLCYGPFVGSVMNILGNLLGNLLAIYLMRHFKFLNKGNASNHWVKAIAHMNHPRLGIMVAYMVPVIPSFLVNYTADLLKVPISQLFFSVILGVAPSSVLYAFGGEALFRGNHKLAIILVASVIVFVVLVSVIHRDRRNIDTVDEN